MGSKIDASIEAAERTSVLANERTYAAWIRTGLTSLAAGLAFERFLGGIVPNFVIHYLSSTLLLLSVTCFFLGAWRYRHVGKRLKSESVTGAPDYLLIAMSALLAVASILALVTLWIFVRSER